MRRALVSVAGGFGVMLVVVCCLSFSSQSWLQHVFFWMLAFPIFIFDPLLPPRPNPNDPLTYLPSIEAAWATLIFDLIFYSLLVYIILRVRESRKGVAPPAHRGPTVI